MRGAFCLGIINLFIILDLAAQDLESVIGKLNSDSRRADTILVFAQRYFTAAKFDSARYWLDKGMLYAEKSGNPSKLASYNIMKASLSALQGKFRSSIQYLHIATKFADEANDHELKVKSFVQLAVSYNGINKKDSAIYFYRLAERYNNEENPYANWIVYSGLAELFSYADDFPEAERYYRRAYNITSEKNNSRAYRDYLLNHGYVLTMFINFYIVWKNPEGAGKLLQEYDGLMTQRKEKNVKEPLQDLLANTIDVRLANDLPFMESIRENSIANGNISQTLIANEYIIRHLKKRKMFDEALKYAEENNALAQATGSIQNIYFSRQMKYELLKSLNRFSEASAVADTLFDLKDSILSLQRREQIYELEKRYESEKREKAIELLVSQNALDYKTIALLQKDKKITALLLQQEMSMSGALSRENQLKDSIVKSEKAYSLSVVKEREQQSALNDALDRENKLKANQLGRERTTKWILGASAVMILASGIFALSLYRRQKKKSNIIQKQANDLEVLMKEIHHRVKNNLQIVSSLLDLQRHTITDLQASEAVKEGKNRVQSMALIHQNLYAEGNIKTIQVKEYVANLLKNLCDSYNITSEKVNISSDIDNLHLDIDTMIPLGLVLNELVTNSLKYAFPDGHAGKLSIVLKEEQEYLLLKVSDNGRGYPYEFDVHNSKSFGMKMIKAFAQKLKAKLDIYNNNGAVAEMRITKYSIA